MAPIEGDPDRIKSDAGTKPPMSETIPSPSATGVPRDLPVPHTPSTTTACSSSTRMSEGCGTVGFDQMSDVEESGKLNGDGEMSDESGNILTGPSHVLSVGSTSCCEEDKQASQLSVPTEEYALIRNESPQSEKPSDLDSNQVRVPVVTSDPVVGETQQPVVTSDPVVGEAQQPVVTSDPVVGETQQPVVTSDPVVGETQQPVVTSDPDIGKGLSGSPVPLNGGHSIQQKPNTKLNDSSRYKTGLDEEEPLPVSSERAVSTELTEIDPSNGKGLSDVTPAHSTVSDDDNLQRNETHGPWKILRCCLYFLLLPWACYYLQRLPDSNYPRHLVQDINSLTPANIICFKRSTIPGVTMYWHYAIIEHVDSVNNDIIVIEYQGDKIPWKLSVKRTIHNVYDEQVWLVKVNPSKSLPMEKVLERAREKIGTAEYNVFKNNCETFAMWCKTGSGFSSQVRFIRTVISRAIGTIAFGWIIMLRHISANS